MSQSVHGRPEINIKPDELSLSVFACVPSPLRVNVYALRCGDKLSSDDDLP